MTKFDAPWNKIDYGHCWTVRDANDLCLVNVPYGGASSIGTNPERLTAKEAEQLAGAIMALPDRPKLSKDAEAALTRFMASRPDLKSRGQAISYLVEDALTGLGDLALPKENRGPGARRGG